MTKVTAYKIGGIISWHTPVYVGFRVYIISNQIFCKAMRALILCPFCLFFLSVHSQDVFMAPYNPDVNADSVITTPDLLGFLPLFGTEFTAAEMTIDGQTLTEYIAVLEEAAANAEHDLYSGVRSW